MKIAPDSGIYQMNGDEFRQQQQQQQQQPSRIQGIPPGN